ncbi:MAG: NADH-quinone oxidoreductase subunit J [Pseudomonadota bacterium]
MNIDGKLVADGAFLGVVALVFGGALIAVLAQNILHAVLGLVVSFFGVAGLYVYLGSGFVAAMQILIYVGAVCIAIMFAIMLSEPLYKPAAMPDPMKVGLSAGMAALIFGVIAMLVLRTHWVKAAPTSNDWSMTAVGQSLLTHYVVVFELISVVLLVAIIGAMTTARRMR